MYSLFLVGVTLSLTSANGFNFLSLRYLIAFSHSQEIRAPSTEQRREGGSEIGQYSLQAFYSCNSLTKNLVSSEWNNFNVHFALDVFLKLTQA